MDRRKKSKPKSAPGARGQAPRRRSPGRPSKAEQERILREDAWQVVEEFTLRPLRAPIDPQFEPYYKRVLARDLSAIADYCDASVPRSNLDSSFYEFLGHLETIRFYPVVLRILLDIERRGIIHWPSKRDAYLYWYGKLKPLCDKARKFIRTAHKSGASVNREGLWHDYLFQPLPHARFVGFIGRPNEESLQRGENARQQEARHQAIEKLIKQSEFATIIGQVNMHTPYGLVPKNVFFDLAESRMSSGKRICKWKPSEVAGHYAGQITGTSPSTASHAGK